MSERADEVDLAPRRRTMDWLIHNLPETCSDDPHRHQLDEHCPCRPLVVWPYGESLATVYHQPTSGDHEPDGD